MRSVNGIEPKVLKSSLLSKSTIRQRSARVKRTIVSSLLLTSLVDAFSILVIFLIMNSASSQAPLSSDGLNLPSSHQSYEITEGHTVKIKDGRYFVNGESTSLGALEMALAKVFKIKKANIDQSHSLIILADKEMDYSSLNPIMLAGSKAGFQQFKFAVVSD